MASKLTPAQRVALARHPERPGTADFIKHLFTDFFEQRGDRLCAENGSILGGVALFHGKPVTVIGHRKGRSLEENLSLHFGMPSPEGYRKAQRLMLQAEKFRRPVITFIDTPGAYPGLEAEARGQAEAIARTLALSSRLTVPIVSVVTGEGGSGGALALGVGNRVLMLENAVYSVLSPEGFAAILWKDASRSDEACGVMKLTAADLLETLAYHKAGCVGMAANMIGVNKRIIAFDNEGTYMVMFNPEIVKRSGPYDAEEGCLSLSGIRPARRWTSIKVRWQNEKFQERLKTFTGWTAQIIQHEIDHCEGIII